MGTFSRTKLPAAVSPCANDCIAAKAKDEILIQGARERAKVIGQRRQTPPNVCEQTAKQVPNVAGRMERYEAALPGARAARDMNELGAKNGARVTQPCISRLPLDAAGLNRALGIDPSGPNAIKQPDLQNEKIGYRTALYRDETNGQLILVSRDTDPHSLVDWKTNIENGDGQDTDQYASVRGLSTKLVKNGQRFDIAGYSKGGGLAQEAALMSPKSQVYVFNSAGLDPASLARTHQQSFDSLASRTHAFSSEHEFLTYMNNTTDPAQKLANAQFLREQLAGPTGFNVAAMAKPMQIQYPTTANTDPATPGFEHDRAEFLRELDSLIKKREVNFPPVRAATRDTIPNSIGRSPIPGGMTISNDNWLLNASGEGPTVGKLAQHQISNVVGPDAAHPGPMEKQIAADRQFLTNFRRRCG